MAVRIMRSNLLQTLGSVIVPSSELASMPRANLLKQGASVRLRFAGPWVITTDVNDKIPFFRGSAFTAVIPAGIYATAALLAAAIVAAMELQDSTPVWACSYDAGTKKFTISSNLAFILSFGPLFGDDVALDLGYAQVDTASAITHTAGEASYQSRHWIHLDLGSALPATAAIVRGHNISASGLVRMDGYSISLVAHPLGIPPGTVQTLTGTDPRSVFFASQSDRYLRLVIDDVQNPAGFNEVGVWFVGAYDQLSVLPSVRYSKSNEHLSEVHFADGGANHQVLRTRRRVYQLLFQLEERGGLAVADRAIFDALDALGIGTNFFQSFDHPSDGVVTVYGFNRVGLHEVYEGGTIWAIQQELAESLG